MKSSMAARFGRVDLVQLGPVEATKSVRSVTPMRVQQFNDERLTYPFIHGAWDDAVTFQ